jgi:hypothetical protein
MKTGDIFMYCFSYLTSYCVSRFKVISLLLVSHILLRGEPERKKGKAQTQKTTAQLEIGETIK